MPHVFVPPSLRELCDGQTDLLLPGTSIRQLIVAWEERCPGIRDRLCLGDELRPGLAVAVDGMLSNRGLLQKVSEQAEVHFLPALGGG